jgi:ParB-like chromosome segregation protein Spo0J
VIPTVATKTTAPVTAPTWRNRITGSGEEAPDQLLANPANWRIHPKAPQDALAGALDQVGWVQQVLVNRRSGFVVDGHARVALALSRGEPSVPVLYVDLEPEEEALILATLDPIGAMAGRDEEKLRALLADVVVDDAGLLALLGDLGGSEPKAGLTDPDEVPEPPAEPYIKPGELYRLGDDRLLCGAATNTDDVARLLAGAAPTLLATDPP